MISFPRTPREITAAWLTKALANAGRIDAGFITRVEVEKLSEGFTGPVVRVHTTLSSGALRGAETIVVKMPTDDEDRLRYLSGLGLFRREYLFYRNLASKMPEILPRIYFVATNADSTMGVIGLEDLGGMRTVPCGVSPSIGDAVSAVRTLARIHAKWWGSQDLLAYDWLMHPGVYFDGEDQAQLSANTQAVIDRVGDQLSSGVIRLLKGLPEALPAIEAKWGSGPTTLCMGDARGQNMFFDGSGDNIRTILIDWQAPLRSIGVLDMATFLVMTFPPDERRSIERDLLTEYDSELVTEGVSDYPMDQLENDFRWALFHPLITMVRAAPVLGDRAIARIGPQMEAMVDWDCVELIS